MTLSATDKEIPAVMAAVAAVEPNLKFALDPTLLSKVKVTMSLDLQYEVAAGETAELKITITP